MFATIFRHELRQMYKSRATVCLLLMLVAALGFAVWNGERAVQKHVAASAFAVEQQAQKQQQWRDDLIAYEQYAAEQGIPTEIAPPAYRPAPYGEPALGTNAGTVGEKLDAATVLPPTGLAAFSIGQLDLQRGYSLVNMKSRFFISDNYEIENPANLATGTFDLSFIVLFLLPVFILALTYDLVSGEQEAGTLALVRAQPVSMRKFLAAKVAARAAILVTVIVVCGVLAFAYVAAGSSAFGMRDSVLRLMLWFGATLIYSLFWFALGVRVNSLRTGSETNATILACAWLCLVVIAPTVISLLATTLYPAPSRMTLKVAQRDAFAQAEASLDETKRKFYIDHAEMVPEEDIEEYTLSFLARQQAMEQAVEPVYQEFDRQKARQEALVARLQYASPTIILQRLLNDISGTDTTRFSDYLEQVYAFHAVRKDYFLPKYINREILVSSDYDEFPVFDYEAEGAGAVIRRSAIPLLCLFLASVLVYPRRIDLSGRRSHRGTAKSLAPLPANLGKPDAPGN